MNTPAIDYGPLAGLIGIWEGDKGTDVSPEPAGDETSPYFETIVYEEAGQVDNAATQKLSVVRYRQTVSRKSNNVVFHDQVGYWTWDPKTGIIAQSLAIPRAVCALAGGKATTNSDGTIQVTVAAKLGDKDWGIIQSPFMRDNASTVEFRHSFTLKGKTMSYTETVVLNIYGRTMDHTDKNELTRRN